MTTIQNVGLVPSQPYVAGDYLELVVSVVDGAGAVVDLTDLQGARYAITAAPSSSTALVSKSLGSGVAVTNAEGGEITATLDNGDTGALAGSYRHEFEIIDAAGRVSTVLQGQFKITAQMILPV